MFLLSLSPLLASAYTIPDWELARAVKPTPTIHAADAVHKIPGLLNTLITKNSPADHSPCEEFSLDELKQIYHTVHSKRHSDFEKVYAHAEDNRRLRLKDRLAIERDFAEDRRLALKDPESEEHLVAGKCAEILMLFTHHLTQDARNSLSGVRLPLMSESISSHEQIEASPHKEKLGRELTCFSCHYQKPGKMDLTEDDLRKSQRFHHMLSNKFASQSNADACGTDDGNPHKWDRTRRCDENCDPGNTGKICGLCEGIGGIARSDDADDYDPTTCSIVATAEEIKASGITPVTPVWPKQFVNTGIYEIIISVKRDPFCFATFPGPNSTFTNCYVAQEGAYYYDWPNGRLRFDYNRKWYDWTRNITEHIYHGADPKDAYMMNIVTKKFLLGVSDFCVCASPKTGIVTYDCFSDATYLGREKLGIEFLWDTHLVDHWTKGPHHFWVDVNSGFLIRMWQPWNGLEIMDPNKWSLEINDAVFDAADRSACGSWHSQGC